MFKEEKFNKILIVILSLIFITIVLIVFIGQKSDLKVLDFEVSNTINDTAPIDSQISITFNRLLDKSLFEKNFIITPSVDGNFAWTGKKVIFTPKKSFLYDTTYTITLNNTYIKDIEGNNLKNNYIQKFRTKSLSLYYISQQDESKGYLVKYNLSNKSSENIITKNTESYSISPDGRYIVYSIGDSINDNSISSIYILNIQNKEQNEIKFNSKLLPNNPKGIHVQKLLFGHNDIAILAHPIYDKDTDSAYGNIIFLYNLSTTDMSIFSPKDKIDDTNTMFYTPDFSSLLYRNSEQNYSYSKIKGGDPVILDQYISINGFNYKADKLAITNLDQNNPDVQYVGYVDANRQKIKLSQRETQDQDPQFANTDNNIVYSEKMADINNFSLFGLITQNIDTKMANLLYFDSNYSSELPSWSPDDKYIAFERYTVSQVENSLTQNRIVFNTVKPLFGQITLINVDSKAINIASEKGRDLTWDK